MSAVGIVVLHSTMPGKRDAVCAVWMEHMKGAVSENPGHLDYFYCADRNNPDAILAFQLYENIEASQAFLQSPAYRRYVEAVEPLLLGAPEVVQTDLLWRKG